MAEPTLDVGKGYRVSEPSRSIHHTNVTFNFLFAALAAAKLPAMTYFSTGAVSTSGSKALPCKAKRRAFTLVEMIAVIAIIAIAGAVVLPTVTSISKSSARRSAVTQALSTLDQTRAMAVSNSSVYFLAVADQNPAWPEEFRCRAFAIYQEVYNTKADRYDRFPVTAWKQLPTGVAFKPDADTVFGSTKETFYCHPAGKELLVPCFKFNSVGGVDEPTDTKLACLRLFEGFFNGAGQPIATNSAGKAGEEVLRVSLVTGRARREDS